MEVTLILTAISGLAIIVLIYRGGKEPVRTSQSDPVWLKIRRRQDPNFALPDPSDVSHPEKTLMWTTQIPVLRFVSDREPRGVYYTPLKLMYLEMARSYPELFDGSTFQQWVEFYVRVGVFRFEDDAIHITRAGNGLLDFLADAAAHQPIQR